MKKIFLLALCALSLLPAAATAATYTTVSGTFRFGDAQSVLTLVNKQRSSYGRSSLVMTKELTEVAMMRAAELAVKFSHTRPNGQSYPSVVPRNYTCAENIANGQTTPSVVVTDWMNSPGHRSNILDPDFSYIGIGCFKCGSQYYWVQVFSDKYNAKETRASNKSVKVAVSLVTSVKTTVTYTSSSTKYCTIKFHANGGKGKMSDQKVKVGVEFTLKKNAFTRSGYVFRGWAESKSGSVVVGNQGTGIPGNEGTQHLYAQWAKKSYKVAFYANGGKGKMAAQAMTYGKAAKLRKNAFKKSGSSFAGWAKTKTGKVVYKNGQSVKNLTASGKTVKLYAKWKKNSAKYITVKFYANGGKGKMADQKMKVATGTYPTTHKNTFTRAGYEFARWYNPINGEYLRDGFWVDVDSWYNAGYRTLKFYAKWKKKSKSKSPKTASAAAADVRDAPASLPAADEPWAVATTSDGSDGSAVLDGDETTAWSPATADGSWVVLSFEDVLDVSDVEVLGENLPEGTRILFSQDADDWTEDLPCAARYVWVAFPEADLPPIVKEIRVEKE